MNTDEVGMMIEDFAGRIPVELQKKSGKVFYSGREAFESYSPVYLLGLNPGGSPQQLGEETVEKHTRSVLGEFPAHWSAYCDEKWSHKPPGESSMQLRVLHLLQQLGLEPRTTPASNLIFVRSTRAATLVGGVQQLADTCWPFHQQVLNQLKPRLVVCFGREVSRFVRNKVAAYSTVNQFEETNQRGWTSATFRNADGMLVGAVTHPSTADWTTPSSDPSPLLASALQL